MISDPPQTYDLERIELMKKTMPPLEVHSGEIGPVDYSTPACTYIPKTKSEKEACYSIAHEEKMNYIQWDRYGLFIWSKEEEIGA